MVVAVRLIHHVAGQPPINHVPHCHQVVDGHRAMALGSNAHTSAKTS